MIGLIKTKHDYLIFAFMFRKITALVFMLAFVSQTFSAPFIMLDYFANTAGYAKNCINKARPKLHCNGKCQVMKKMRAEEKKEQENTERRSGGKLEVLSAKSFYPTIIQPVSTLIAAVTCCIYLNGHHTDRPYDFFHPPQV